jgi:hypothetical protein
VNGEANGQDGPLSWEEGQHSVVIAGPGGEWRWSGYANNRTDALYRALAALEEELSQ